MGSPFFSCIDKMLDKKTKLIFLIVLAVLSSAKIFVQGLEFENNEDPNKILSRHRRFLLPNATGTSAEVEFSLTVPFGSGTPALEIILPFEYAFDTGSISGRRDFS